MPGFRVSQTSTRCEALSRSDLNASLVRCEHVSVRPVCYSQQRSGQGVESAGARGFSRNRRAGYVRSGTYIKISPGEVSTGICVDDPLRTWICGGRTPYIINKSFVFIMYGDASPPPPPICGHYLWTLDSYMIALFLFEKAFVNTYEPFLQNEIHFGEWLQQQTLLFLACTYWNWIISLKYACTTSN